MNVTKNVMPPIFIVLAFAALSGCGGNDDTVTPTPTDGDGTIQIDATAGGFGVAPDDPANKYAYFDLDTGEVINLSDADAETNRRRVGT